MILDRSKLFLPSDQYRMILTELSWILILEFRLELPFEPITAEFWFNCLFSS